MLEELELGESVVVGRGEIIVGVSGDLMSSGLIRGW